MFFQACLDLNSDHGKQNAYIDMTSERGFSQSLALQKFCPSISQNPAVCGETVGIVHIDASCNACLYEDCTKLFCQFASKSAKFQATECSLGQREVVTLDTFCLSNLSIKILDLCERVPAWQARFTLEARSPKFNMHMSSKRGTAFRAFLPPGSSLVV